VHIDNELSQSLLNYPENPYLAENSGNLAENIIQKKLTKIHQERISKIRDQKRGELLAY